MGRDVNLWLDDSYERTAVAYQRMIPADRDSTIWCRTASEAIEVLRDYSERLKKVHLDHDLGGESEDVPMHSGNENSGMEVIRYLENIDPKLFDGCKFIIHSFNTYAARRMFERLDIIGYDVKYQPFGTGKL